MKVDIGCGKSKRVGYIGLDKARFEGVDIVADFERGLPLKEASCNEIYTSHTLEHLSDPNFLMEEIHRVLVAGGGTINHQSTSLHEQ